MKACRKTAKKEFNSQLSRVFIGLMLFTFCCSQSYGVDIDPINVADGKPIINGSGSWQSLAFDDDTDGFAAFHVTDGGAAGTSVSDVFQGNYWLGRQLTANEFFTVDLEAPVDIGEFRLFNTHNELHNDRGTIDFRILASNSIDGSNQLISPTTILDDTLTDVALQNPITADVFNDNFGTFQYLQFQVDSFKRNGAGLNEIRVFAAAGVAAVPEPSTYAMFATIVLGAGYMLRRNRKKEKNEVIDTVSS